MDKNMDTVLNNKRRAIITGSFDPITLGHYDIIKKASEDFDEIVIAILKNPNKKGLFETPFRIELIERIIKAENLKNVTIECFDGLLVNFMKENNIQISVRGLRTSEDFIYEQRLDMTNKKAWSKYRTYYLLTEPEYLNCSSSTVRELLMFDGDITPYVHPSTTKLIIDKYKELLNK